MGSCIFYYAKSHAADDAFDLAWAQIVHLVVSQFIICPACTKFHLQYITRIMLLPSARGYIKSGAGNQILASTAPSDKNCNIAARTGQSVLNDTNYYWLLEKLVAM